MDNCANMHICNNLELFEDFQEVVLPDGITTASEEALPKGVGGVRLN